jgi:multicomponent Na+:H+ antiporter subunit D
MNTSLIEITSIRPVLAILVSLIAAILISFTSKNQNLRETWTFLAAFIKFSIIASLLPMVMSGKIITFTLFEFLPDIYCQFRIDTLGIYFALLSSTLWIITSVYSVGYMRTLKEKQQTRYYASFALSLCATIGIAFAGDLITFFIFYELLTLATYPLVAHKETKAAVMAGRKYLLYSLSAGVLLLIGIAWIIMQTGQVTFQAGGFLNGHAFNQKELFIVFFMFVYGCGVKSGLFPVHAWLPSAMVAPTPVSALLHAVAVVKAGVFGILRITGFVFGPLTLEKANLQEPLSWIAAFTILGASCIALAQDNLKRRLAYSTISQLSYIILGVSLLSPAGFTGSMLHLVNHALMKITLFFCAGAIYAKTHIENISEMQGLARKMPIIFTTFAIASASLAGFPLFSGFISKWYFCLGALQAERPVFFGVYLLSTFLNIAYLFPVLIMGLRSGGKNMNLKIEESPWTLISPPVITAFGVILLGTSYWLIRAQLSLAHTVSEQIFKGVL